MPGKERTEGPPINTLADIKQRLNQRQSGFFNRFIEVATAALPNTGWERIQALHTGRVVKTTFRDEFDAFSSPGVTFADQPGVRFTGKGFCPVISGVLYTALASSVGENIRVSLGNIETDMNRENWGREDYNLSSTKKNHAAVKATDLVTGEVMYIDGSYGQVDYQYAGEISTFSEREFVEHYRTAAGTVPAFEEVQPDHIQEMTERSYNLVHFRPEDIENLVELLKFSAPNS